MNEVFNYISPFSNRYGTDKMRAVFSDEHKYSTWRYLWYVLAKSEKEMGLNITDEQLAELKSNIYNIDFARAAEIEQECKHDVMAHIRAFGEICPTAKPIIHLGATSCYVTDNTDVLQCNEAIKLVKKSLIKVIRLLIKFAHENKSVPTLAYTHLQPAQPTTIGKRACMWLQDLTMDLQELEHHKSEIKLLGCKGATGTAASFMQLFDDDWHKVNKLEKLILKELPVKSTFIVSGQTYTRKQDSNLMHVLSGIAQSASKFANDIRLLSNLGEIEEPHAKNQVGSSAMPYKSNPVRCEKICSLSRFIICGEHNFSVTASEQWLERTLDDSANRRLMIPQMFLAIDEVLNIYSAILEEGLQVNYNKISANINSQLPYMLMENVLMCCTNKGGDRQELHDRIRVCCNEAKELGVDHLLDRIIKDEKFDITTEEIMWMAKPQNLTGMASLQASYVTYATTVVNKLDE